MESANIYIAMLLCVPIIFVFITSKKKAAAEASRRLPPGSLGWIPVIGQTIQLFQAMRANKGEEWLRKRAQKYGPISKLHIFGSPTVFLHGQAANKFIYTCNDKVLSSQHPGVVRRILGERNILELSGEDHKRVRWALLSFLKPEALRKHIATIDEEIKIHLKNHWHGRHQIFAVPLTKTLTLNIVCTLIFGVERGARRDELAEHFRVMVLGLIALPVNLPFTRYNRGLRARSKIRDIVMELIHEKREKLQSQREKSDDNGDLITSLLSMRRDDDEIDSPRLSDEEIVDNCIAVLFGGYDTSASLLSFLIKLLAENQEVYTNVLKEHEEIARGKASKELLTWEDISMMKYTWRVATELLRLNPPAFIGIRKVLKDTEFGGYVIPKGWQVVWTGSMTHMDESIFADPMKFDPSRFENKGKIPPYSFIPFGVGSRMCPGYELVRVETLVLIHYLVTRFQWKLSSQENFFGRDPMPVFYNGLPIQVHDRDLMKPSDDVL